VQKNITYVSIAGIKCDTVDIVQPLSNYAPSSILASLSYILIYNVY